MIILCQIKFSVLYPNNTAPYGSVSRRQVTKRALFEQSFGGFSLDARAKAKKMQYFSFYLFSLVRFALIG